MCLAIPGKVVEIFQEHQILMGIVEFSGITKRICLESVSDIKLGEYVIVHVGFALARIDEVEAKRIFDLLAEMENINQLNFTGADREIS